MTVVADMADSVRFTEPINGPYGYATGAFAAVNASDRPASSEDQPAIPGKIPISQRFYLGLHT